MNAARAASLGMATALTPAPQFFFYFHQKDFTVGNTNLSIADESKKRAISLNDVSEM